MRICIHLDECDKGTPIETANAIIRNYMDRAEYFKTDDAMDKSYSNLAEIAEYILTYVKYNRKPVITFLDENAGLREE